MKKNDLIEKNPIRYLKCDGGGASCRMGLVMARAGLGKTALLVQIALDALLNDRQVVHVSVGQTIDKTKLWYDDMFKDIAEGMQLEGAAEVHNEIARNRMIITFNESQFSRAKLEERLNDLICQNLIRPSCMVVDGFDFAHAERSILEEMREMAETMGMQIWFSAISHREDNRRSAAGVPAPCHTIDDLFDTIIQLQPASEGGCINLDILKGSADAGKCGKLLKLDPMTFMIKEDCK